VDQPGCSYNPDAGQHQEAVAEAVAAEVQKQLAAELAPKPLEMVATSEAKQDDLRMLQVLLQRGCNSAVMPALCMMPWS
jgi:Nop53 (60S ribosomal biogenesis)